MPIFYEEGEAITTGSHGQHKWLYVEGTPVPDSGVSALIFEGGTGLGGVAFVEDFEDQDWTDNFSVVHGDWSIVTESYEGSYAAEGTRTSNNQDAVLASNKDVDTFGLKFRYRVKVKNTSYDSEDGDLRFGYQDLDNFYMVNVKPANTDNPQFSVYEVVNGSRNTLVSVSPDFSREEWLTVRGETDADGNMAFEIDHSGGTQRITCQSKETSLTPGKIAPRAYVDAIYDLIEVNTENVPSIL